MQKMKTMMIAKKTPPTMTSKIGQLGLMILLCLGALSPLQAQKLIQPKPKASTLAMATYLDGDNYLKVTYGQPLKKGRAIFGDLVPYGQIWRTGANEATEFTTTRDIKIDKRTLKAGTYTIFSIPDKDQWTVIFNGVLGQWGAYKYEEVKSKNVLEMPIKVQSGEDEYEAFTIQFEPDKKGANLVLLWDKTRIVIPITFVTTVKTK
ncbi:MAG: DUF2911 domain-containing protein [Microscillaceae bacterium]|nr:DUF2911 domain-containing protein [Microscillaceae bacterium]